MDEIEQANLEGAEEMVDIGDHRLLLRCTGTGWPTVVLEAGLGDTSLSAEWTSIQQRVATFTRCCGYACTGLGKSEPGHGQRTSIRAVNDLHIMLHSAGIEGPYVLVGHSLGGLHVQLFAACYPDEVAGVVLVDAMHEDHLVWLERNQLSAEELEGQRQVTTGNNPEGIASDTALTALQQAHWRLDVPLVVLMRDHVPPEEQPPEWSSEREELLLATWHEVQSDLANRSHRGRLIVAERSGHNIQLYRPDVIIEAIREVVAAARTQPATAVDAQPPTN
ncbi:MAG TPA: alpha/beta hydrolase [Ktedonobacterales bacterium]|nr:alpha/beta hydrolase [Ktedonobacterales bacterium]